MFHVYGYRNESGTMGIGYLIKRCRTLAAAKKAADVVSRGGAFADVKQDGRHVVYSVSPGAAIVEETAGEMLRTLYVARNLTFAQVAERGTPAEKSAAAKLVEMIHAVRGDEIFDDATIGEHLAATYGVDAGSTIGRSVEIDELRLAAAQAICNRGYSPREAAKIISLPRGSDVYLRLAEWSREPVGFVAHESDRFIGDGRDSDYETDA